MRIYRHKETHEFISALDLSVHEGTGDETHRTKVATFVEPDAALYEAIEVEDMTPEEFSHNILGPAVRKEGGGFRRVLIEDGNPLDATRPDELARLPTGHHLRAKPEE